VTPESGEDGGGIFVIFLDRPEQAENLFGFFLDFLTFVGKKNCLQGGVEGVGKA